MWMLVPKLSALLLGFGVELPADSGGQRLLRRVQIRTRSGEKTFLFNHSREK
jgi:hypothetical protein